MPCIQIRFAGITQLANDTLLAPPRSSSTQALDAGTAAEQERAHWLVAAGASGLQPHRQLPRLRGRRAQGHREGQRTHTRANRGRGLHAGEMRLQHRELSFTKSRIVHRSPQICVQE